KVPSTSTITALRLPCPIFFPYTTLFRSQEVKAIVRVAHNEKQSGFPVSQGVQLQLVVGRDFPQLRNVEHGKARTAGDQDGFCVLDRKSTRLNSSHVSISYAVICLKKEMI